MIDIKKEIVGLLVLFLIIISSYLVTAPVWYGTSTNQDNNLVGHWACEGNAQKRPVFFGTLRNSAGISHGFDDSSSYGNDGTQGGVHIQNGKN